MPTSPGWKSLGHRITQRRVEVGLGSQRALAHRTGLSERVVGKAEAGQSVNRSTLAAIELALGWAPGSASDILDGGEPTLTDRADQTADPSYQAILDAPGLTDGEKVDAIAAIEARRARIARGGFTEDQQDILRKAPAAYKKLMDRKRDRDSGNAEVTGESALGALEASDGRTA